MKQYRFKIKYEGDYSYSWGYAIYSAFLEGLKEESADGLHKCKLFNQYITPTEWIINTEKDYSFKDSYFLHKFDRNIILTEKNIENINEQHIADKYLISEPYKKKIRISFLTPTTFKKDGEHVLYPTIDLIMQSLTNKWNEWADEFVLEDMNWDNCKIFRYNLRSSLFHLKNARIQGFTGYVDILFWGSESMIRLANMVCNFAEFSGIGIKAALGMGGVRIE